MSKKLEDDVVKIFKELQKAEFGNYKWFFLLDLAQRVSLVSGFQFLISLEDFNISLFPHQKQAALQILQNMQGSALLADEVGLGKTIIALTVLSELKLRNLVNSVLIIVPSSLVDQWYNELIEKFNMEIPVAASGRSNFKQDELITSLAMLRRYPELITNRSWDMIIVDEAHRIKSKDSVGWQILNKMKKKYMLLLTATPMENTLQDIYNLTTLLKPIFGTYNEFKKQYVVSGNKRACKDPIKLRQNLNQIMIRRKREEIEGIFFPERVANTLQFILNDSERKFYDLVSDFVITNYSELDKESTKETEDYIINKYNIESKRFFKRKIWLHKLTLMLLQRRICSSPLAASITLTNMINSRETNKFDLSSVPSLKVLQNLAEQLSNKESSKLLQLKQIVERIPEKCVIFTEFKDTLDYISNFFKTQDLKYLTFSGELSSSQRADVIQKFNNNSNVLLSTDAGSEGLNLQAANTIINFDLPWNPMRIEQRIGRIYRLTQKSEQVYIFNLTSKDTIEQYVLDILYQKIGIFRTILGDLSSILGSLIKSNEDGRSIQLESEIMKFFVRHGHSEKLQKDLEEMIQPVADIIENQEKISHDVLDVGQLIQKY